MAIVDQYVAPHKIYSTGGGLEGSFQYADFFARPAPTPGKAKFALNNAATGETAQQSPSAHYNLPTP